MNTTKLLFRLTLAVTILLLIAAAALPLVDGAQRAQVALIALGILSGLLSNQLRFRMVLSAQKANQRAFTNVVQQLLSDRSMVKDREGTLESSTALDAILTGLGDTQAVVAASESFLLAELTMLRQRLSSQQPPAEDAKGHQG